MPRIKHNMSHSPEFNAWRNMKDRCLCKTNHAYPRYGGRGIGIYEPWIHSFENFLSDMGKRPAGNYALERKNNDLGYSPENCEWVTMKQQGNNRRTNVRMEFNGVSKTVAQWSESTGIPHSTIARRIAVGYPPEKVLSNAKFKRPKQASSSSDKEVSVIFEITSAAIEFEKLAPKTESDSSVRARLVSAIVSANKYMRKATS